MANNVQTQSTTSEIISLLRDTVGDIKDLFTQEAAAARAEVRAEWHQVKTAFVMLAVGVAVIIIGGGLWAQMFAQVVYNFTDIPLWGSYGVTGAAVIILGIACLFIGKNRTQDIDIVPRRSVEAMKEDIQWINNRVSSNRT